MVIQYAWRPLVRGVVVQLNAYLALLFVLVIRHKLRAKTTRHHFISTTTQIVQEDRLHCFYGEGALTHEKNMDISTYVA